MPAGRRQVSRIALRLTFATTAPIDHGERRDDHRRVRGAAAVVGVPNRMLGLLVCISLLICAVMSLLIVPGLADIFRLRRTVPSEHLRVVVAEPKPDPVSA